MVVLKALTVIVFGVLTLLAFRHVMRQVEAARVKVRAHRPRDPRAVKRLRQDPRTGVYYPVD